MPTCKWFPKADKNCNFTLQQEQQQQKNQKTNRNKSLKEQLQLCRNTTKHQKMTRKQEVMAYGLKTGRYEM